MVNSNKLSGHPKWLVYITLNAIYSVRDNETVID